MRISCVFVVSLLSSLPLSFLPAAALAAQAQSDDPSQSALRVPGSQALSSQTTTQFAIMQQAPGTPPGFETTPLDDEAMQTLMARLKDRANSAMTKPDTLCYSIESYQFTRENPDSDATRLTERSACQAAAQFQFAPVTPAKSVTHCGACAPNLEAQTKQEPASSKISTSLSLHSNQVIIGQDVIGTVTIKNISNQNIPLRTDPHYYRLYVEGANGEGDKTRFYHRLNGEFLPGDTDLRGGGVTLEIEPGKSDTMDFNLLRYYKLQKPGEYRARIDCEDESGTWVRSNIVSFELKAAD